MATINKFISARLLMDDGSEIVYPDIFHDGLFNRMIADYNAQYSGMIQMLQEEIDDLEERNASLDRRNDDLRAKVKELAKLAPTTALHVARIKKHGDTVQKAEAAVALQTLRRLSQQVYPRRIAKPKKSKK